MLITWYMSSQQALLVQAAQINMYFSFKLIFTYTRSFVLQTNNSSCLILRCGYFLNLKFAHCPRIPELSLQKQRCHRICNYESVKSLETFMHIYYHNGTQLHFLFKFDYVMVVYAWLGILFKYGN